ncbi:hypothetical protein O6H91_16G005800 [Diphasiastrum complanatum]|uniref:Uncharacterized protein n=1 Tax=Diphasiastrum complanatum TaxID=34168 RepID=A0ACC2B9I7_DIPCM|nr:hypothetical protein O6H91_16G005800 [Diphasiastrum complanatum]
MVESLLHGTLLELLQPQDGVQGEQQQRLAHCHIHIAHAQGHVKGLSNVTTKPSNESTRKPIALKKVVQDSSCHKKNAIEKSFQTCNIDPAFTLVGKGFSFPVEVSLANVRTKQLHDPTHVKHKPINQLYFKVVSYAGVDYSIGDCVEIWNLRRKVKLSVRIGGKILICSDQASSQNELKSECSLRSSDLNNFDYLCNFFYDHEQQSLHQLS